MLLALTGPSPFTGQATQMGAETYLDEIGWTINGRKLEIIIEDEAGDAAVALAKAKKLVESDKVDVVLGPTFDTSAGSVLPYLKTAKIPNVVFSSRSDQTMASGKGNSWVPAGLEKGATYYGGVYAYDKAGFRTITVIHDDYSAGEDYTQGFINAFEKKGGKMIQRQRSPLGTMDYAPYLSSMQKADAVVFWFVPDEGPRFVSQYATYGLKMPLFMASTIGGPEPMLKDFGDAALGTLGVALENTEIDSPANKKFVDEFRKKYHQYPGDHEYYQGYIAMQLYAEAVKATQGDTSVAAINSAMAKLKVNTPAGVISFTPDGVAVGDQYIVKLSKSGDRYYWAPIETYSQVVYNVPQD
jgi:branched-chain amino acid transport system substrate-binding protein